MNLNFLKNLLLKGKLTVEGSTEIGISNIATGTGSFAQGLEVTASGEAAHAEGQETVASGDTSHAEGLGSVASGNRSHAEGSYTIAQGSYSHAEGRYSEAKGSASHAAGFGATAAQNYTYAWADGQLGTLEANLSTTREGQYMINASGGVYIPTNVGIGTDSIDNALTVVGNISATGIISVPNQTALNGNYVLTRDLIDARYFPWSPAAHCFGPIGPAFATNAALGPYMMQSRVDSNYVFGWGTNNSVALGLPFFCNNGKSLSSVRINHTAGTNSNASATLEVGLYAANSSGLPDTFIDKVAFSLSAIGSKVANLTTPYTPTGLFWALVRPISGDTDFKDVTKGGNGTSLTIMGYGNGYNLWASQFFGFGADNSGPTQFHGSLIPRRGSYSTPLPTSSVLSEISMQQTGNITYPCVILY